MEKKWYNFFVVTDAGRGTAKESSSATSAIPSITPKRAVDIVPEAEAEPSFAAPVEDPTSFDEIYSSAQIAPPRHGYTVLKVAEMLQSEHIRALPADVKRKSIMVALDAAGVDVNDIVQDAVKRDRALDTYERVLVKNLENLRAEKDAENRRFEEEINQRLAELRARMAENSKVVAEEQESLLTWRTRKAQEEERIAEAVGYFVSENPITTAGGSSEKK